MAQLLGLSLRSAGTCILHVRHRTRVISMTVSIHCINRLQKHIKQLNTPSVDIANTSAHRLIDIAWSIITRNIAVADPGAPAPLKSETDTCHVAERLACVSVLTAVNISNSFNFTNYIVSSNVYMKSFPRPLLTKIPLQLPDVYYRNTRSAYSNDPHFVVLLGAADK
jgi:hypothetical protein